MTQLKDFKFVTALILLFKKIESEHKTKYDNFHSSSKSEIIINESDIDDVFQSICTTIITNIQKFLGKGLDWITDSVIDHSICTSKYGSLVRRSHIKLPRELDHKRNDLSNIQNTNDNECFKWYLFRYLNPTDHNPRTITKVDKYFAKSLNFKDIKFIVKFRDIHKIEKLNSIGISVFGYENKRNIQSMYQKIFVKLNMLIYN